MEEIKRLPDAQLEVMLVVSCASIAPGQNEVLVNVNQVKTRKGNKFLRHTLVEAARAVTITKETYLSSAQYQKIAARRGSKRLRLQ